MNKIDYLENLIRYKTNGNVEGINECLNFIAEELKKYNWKVKFLKNSENDKLNLLAILGNFDAINEGLLLSGHIDTVETDVNKWKSSPWELRKDKDFYYGLGVSDMKCFTSAILSNLDNISKMSLKNPLVLSLTSDEETIMYGISTICNYMKDNKICPEYALIGEPSSLSIVTSNKGFYEFKTTIDGKSCHSSEPTCGTNAIYIMSQFVLFLENLSNEYLDKNVTMNVGIINGGTMCNIVPGTCSINWEIRTFEEKIVLEIQNKVESYLEKLCTNKKDAKYLNVNTFTIPAFEYRENEFANSIKTKFNLKESYYDAATEAGFYQKLGMDCAIFGAGDIKDAHTYNEKLSITNYDTYCKLLLQIIKEMCC